MRKRKNSIIPFGDFEKVQEQEQVQFNEVQFNQEQEESFYTNPLIPWWIKAAYALSPVPLHNPDRADTWCKLCGRKHSKRDACESLQLVEDLTEPPTRRKKIGYYTTRPKEALAA